MNLKLYKMNNNTYRPKNVYNKITIESFIFDDEH